MFDEPIENQINDLVSRGKRKFVIYPFGRCGKIVRSILNVNCGIEECGIIDNILSERYEGILSLKQIDQVCEDSIVLISSEDPLLHDELLEQLYVAYPKEKCVDLFSDSVAKAKTFIRESEEYQNKREKFMDECFVRRRRALKKAQEVEIDKHELTYHPIKTNSVFFLPYVYSDLIQQEIFISDDYFERDNLNRVFEKLIDNGKLSAIKRQTFVDIGANIGNHTLYFLNELGVENVVCLEPAKETFWILNKNVILNGRQNQVKLMNIGLSDDAGNAMLAKYNFADIGNTSIKEGDGDIDVKTLDSLTIDNVGFIKIDVEGMEYKVLKGGVHTIKQYFPYILVESFKHNFSPVKELLCGWGYSYITVNGRTDDYLFYHE